MTASNRPRYRKHTSECTRLWWEQSFVDISSALTLIDTLERVRRGRKDIWLAVHITQDGCIALTVNLVGHRRGVVRVVPLVYLRNVGSHFDCRLNDAEWCQEHKSIGELTPVTGLQCVVKTVSAHDNRTWNNLKSDEQIACSVQMRCESTRLCGLRILIIIQK